MKSNRVWKRAIVIGAGIGGLSAAAALSRYFSEVVLLERDAFPPGVGSRAGVAQDRQPHLWLSAGLQMLESLLPGIERDLLHAGAVSVNCFREVRYERPDVGALPARDCGLTFLCATRPLVEQLLRQRVASIHNVTLRPSCRVTEITTDAIRRTVKFEIEGRELSSLNADLVVDASGRAVPTLALLDSLGWARPVETTVGVDINYTTFVMTQPPANPYGSKIIVTLPDPSVSAQAGLIMPIEDGRWFVGIAEHGATERPKTWQELLSILRRLQTTTIYNEVCNLQPIDGPRHFVFDESRWRHFELLDRLPYGVLPIGDSICRFNPIYGQGQSVAALQAGLLGDALASVAEEVDPIGLLQSRFMANTAELLETPWNLGVNADFAFPTTRGQRPERYEEGRQFEASLFRAMIADPVVQRAFAKVMHLTEGFGSLHDPDIRQRIEAHAMPEVM